jgi:hypothetical protein
LSTGVGKPETANEAEKNTPIPMPIQSKRHQSPLRI